MTMPRILALGLILSFCMVGCGGPGAILIKPVPAEQELQETVVGGERGLFVSDKIVVVDVEGLLMNQSETGFFSSHENPVSLFIEKLDKAKRDPNVKAMVVRINSPGGGVTASDIMYRHLKQYRCKTKVPVVAIIEDVGASGGYYIACGADTIMVHPTGVTGSIGVIVQTVSFARTLNFLGIDTKAVLSGKFKDMGSPFKPLDEKDRELLQAIVNEYYGRFLKVVEEGRPKLTAAKIKELADGRVYTGEQARVLGLVDGLGYMEEALQEARNRSGVAKAKVIMYHRPLGYRSNAYSETNFHGAQVGQMNVLNVNLPQILNTSQPQFLYLWTGKSE